MKTRCKIWEMRFECCILLFQYEEIQYGFVVIKIMVLTEQCVHFIHITNKQIQAKAKLAAHEQENVAKKGSSRKNKLIVLRTLNIPTSFPL